jgi:hypothetical protein
LRALVLGGALLLMMVVGTVFLVDRGKYDSAYLSLAFLLIAACGTYLMMQKDTRYKVTAIPLFVLAPVLYVLFSAMQTAYLSTLDYNPLALFTERYLLELLQALMLSALIAVASLVIPQFAKRDKKAINNLVALGGCGVILVLGTIISMMVFRSMGIPSIAVRFLNGIPDAAFFFLAFKLVTMLCELKSYGICTGTGHKAWFGVCLVLSTVSLVVMSVGGVVGSMYFMPAAYLFDLFTMLAILGYALLLGSKRMGYLLILIGTGFLFFGQFTAEYYASTLALIGLQNYPLPEHLGALASSLVMVVNPAITGIVLFKAWKLAPVGQFSEKPKVAAVFKIAPFMGIVLGAVLYFAGAYAFYDWHYPEVTGFIFGVLLGGATIILSLFMLLACFRKQSRVNTPLLIANTVLVGIVVLLYAIGFVTIFISMVT